MKRVQVYYNIRRGDDSVRQSGRVIDHGDSIVLSDVRFNVAPAGRDKVRATGVKNVHATVTGYVASPYHSEYLQNSRHSCPLVWILQYRHSDHKQSALVRLNALFADQ